MRLSMMTTAVNSMVTMMTVIEEEEVATTVS